MNRQLQNKDNKFRKASLAHMQEMQEMLEQRRAKMSQEWGSIDRGWEDLREKMSEVGMSMRSANVPDPVVLNVGGSEVYVPRNVLEGLQNSSASWTLGDLVGGGVWDKRLPRDSDGQVFVDGSPAGFQHLVRDFSRKFGRAGASPDMDVEDLPADQVPYLPYVAGALGFPTGMPGTVGSSILKADGIDGWSATILGWCPDKACCLELLYRASRDGWDKDAFLEKNGNAAPTISLVRVKGSSGATRESVVGGFSSVSWNPISSSHGYCDSPGAFLFMLQDGDASGPQLFKPVKWGAKDGLNPTVFVELSTGPGFGSGRSDLLVRLRSGVSIESPEIQAGRRTYDIPEGSPYLNLDERTAVEFEVFRVCSTTPPPAMMQPLHTPASGNIDTGLIDCATIFATDPIAMSTEKHEDNIHLFGDSIAKSLRRESMALRHARTELVKANSQAKVSAQALAAIYGPDVAKGEDDPVVELSVRGSRATTRMATLRSTIQLCPPGTESVLAARFKRWANTESSGKDAYGRWPINDCSPVVFAKLLDVLRMKKRVGWDGNEKEPVRVAVKASDRSEFEQFVNMYFPGCESFIMDSVEFQYPQPRRRPHLRFRRPQLSAPS